MAANSFSFQVRAKTALPSLVTVVVQENNVLLPIMAEPHPSGWTSCSRKPLYVARGTSKHHPLGCCVPFETETTASACAVLLCLKFSSLSPLCVEALPILQGQANDAGHSQAHPTSPSSSAPVMLVRCTLQLTSVTGQLGCRSPSVTR